MMELILEFISKRIFIIITVILAIIAGFVYLRERNKPTLQLDPTPATVIISKTDDPILTVAPDPAMIKVYITGAVKQPGVYEVSADARVDDVLRMAGGPAEDADMKRINLAGFIKDGQQITVPAIGDPDEPQIEQNESKGTDTAVNGKININTAGESELTKLPGIGPATAKNILNYREANGNFGSIEDIKNVNRIGEVTFNNIKDLITVD